MVQLSFLCVSKSLKQNETKFLVSSLLSVVSLLTKKPPTLLKKETQENNKVFWKFPKSFQKTSLAEFIFIAVAIVAYLMWQFFYTLSSFHHHGSIIVDINVIK